MTPLEAQEAITAYCCHHQLRNKNGLNGLKCVTPTCCNSSCWSRQFNIVIAVIGQVYGGKRVSNFSLKLSFFILHTNISGTFRVFKHVQQYGCLPGQTVWKCCYSCRVWAKLWANPFSKCWDISPGNWKLWHASGARGKVRGSLKSLGFILSGTWMSVQNLKQSITQLSRHFSLEEVDQPTLPSQEPKKEPTYHDWHEINKGSLFGFKAHELHFSKDICCHLMPFSVQTTNCQSYRTGTLPTFGVLFNLKDILTDTGARE